MQYALLLASIGVVALAVYCSRVPRASTVAEPDPLDPEDMPILPRSFSAEDEPKPDHAKMRALLAETRAVAAEAEVEKQDRLQAAAAAEAHHVNVGSQIAAKRLKQQKHNKFE